MLVDFTKKSERRRAYIERNSRLKTERTSWVSHWSDIAKVTIPRSARFQSGERNRTGRDRYNKIYDNTPVKALRTLGAGMQTGATNPLRRWFNLTTTDPELADVHSIRMWLDDVVRRMQRVFQRSNVYRTLHKMYEELGAFGTAAAILVADDENVIHLYPLTCGEYCLQQDWKGRVNTCYREFDKTVGELVREFGFDNCSRSVQEQWKNRNFEASIRVLHVIEPRSDQERTPDSPLPEDMEWKSCYMELNGDEDKILRESGFKRFPVLAPRWGIDGDDVYGTSPAMEALGDIRQLQQEQLQKGIGIAFKARPPVQVPTGLVQRESDLFPGGTSYIDPGTVLPFDQVTPNGGVRTAFETKIELDELLIDIQDCRQRINSAFYADLFLMLAMAGTNTRMTATEVAERHEEKLLALGPVMERLHNELLQPLINSTFYIMLEAGLIPPPPPELAGQELSVELVSILAQAQRAIGSNTIDRFMGSVVAMQPVFPQVTDKVDIDKWVDRYGEMLGVDAELIVDAETVKAVRQARAAAQAAQEQAALLSQQASAARDLSQAQTSQPSALTDVLNTGADLPL